MLLFRRFLWKPLRKRLEREREESTISSLIKFFFEIQSMLKFTFPGYIYIAGGSNNSVRFSPFAWFKRLATVLPLFFRRKTFVCCLVNKFPKKLVGKTSSIFLLVLQWKLFYSIPYKFLKTKSWRKLRFFPEETLTTSCFILLCQVQNKKNKY